MRVLQVLRPDVELRSDFGGWHAIRCPFHDDRAASASYNPTTERFRCHGCGISGDGYDLIQEIERCDFSTARLRVSVICGQELSRPSGTSTPPQGSKLAAKRTPQRARLVRSQHARSRLQARQQRSDEGNRT